jgi:hypothetical protein
LLAQKQLEDFSMVDARCSCGAVTLSLPEEPSKIVIACHCLDCQRRTGAPFGVGAYYPADVVTISGTSKEFTHAAASGGKIHNYFCPQCGSTVYWKLSNFPALIGVAVGAMANPKYPAPVRSVEEQTKHDWVQIDGAVEHFRQSSLPKNSNWDTTLALTLRLTGVRDYSVFEDGQRIGRIRFASERSAW